MRLPALVLIPGKAWIAERKGLIPTQQSLTAKPRAEALVWHAAQAAGFSAMVLLDSYSNLVFHPDKVRMHSGVPLVSVVTAEMLDMAILGTLFAVCLYGLGRLPSWPFWEGAVAALLFPLLPWHKVLGLSARYLPAGAFPLLPRLDGSPGPLKTLAAAGCCATLLLLLRAFSSSRYAMLMKLGATVLAGFGIFALITMVQLCRLLPWRPSSFETPPISRISNKGNSPLLVWIVFDELSYGQTFGNRAPGLKLPNLDSFRAESTLYQQVIPASNYTETAIPAMFLGEPVEQITDTPANRLLYQTAGESEWRSFGAERTVFGAARKANLTTGLAGWYNPYCMMLEGTLASCSCSTASSFSYPLSRGGVWPNAVAILKDLVYDAVWPSRAARERNDGLVREFLTTYREVYSRSIPLLKSDGYDFVFLHIPAPHPPSIFDRRTGQFVTTFGKSYLDNLALVDRTLGEFLAILKRSPRWNRTSVVVDGDHTWRSNMWRNIKLFTREDEEISKGGEDPRPALLVHRAGQTAPNTVIQPLQLSRIHDIICELLPEVTPEHPN